MKKVVTFIFLFAILVLSVIGCTDPKKDPSAETQQFSSTGTDLSNQTNSAAGSETSSISDSRPFVSGDDGVDLPIDFFD